MPVGLSKGGFAPLDPGLRAGALSGSPYKKEKEKKEGICYSASV